MSRIERACAFDAISVMDHLRHRGFSERVIALLTVGVFPRDITLGSLLEALEHLQAAVMHRVSGGNDLLPSSLAAALRRSVRLDSTRSEEHTSELQSLMRISYAVFCLKKKRKNNKTIKLS